MISTEAVTGRLLAASPPDDASADTSVGGIDLPALPPLSSFIGKLLLLVCYSLALNMIAAFSAFKLCGSDAALGVFRAFAKWLALVPVLEQNPAAAMFGVCVAIASLSFAIGPVHSLHDRAIKYLHDIELCKRLSLFITGVDFAIEHHGPRSWAQHVSERYRTNRIAGKAFLGLLFIVMAFTIVEPWWLVLRALNWPSVEILIAVVLLAPSTISYGYEVFRMIWPGKNGFRLGEIRYEPGSHGK
jgi:hypothetical protein